ncbi:SpoIIE family protein phosphatase [Hugenholtzia roseola]|uniref:SpoIIE family protein phosphatase n=1 Tax=Hugenholtzia roseola TaxID=1002 RepID=UPI00041E4032|nr:SpoIIE family protein phosphatase [Hugenholtzia roseola]
MKKKTILCVDDEQIVLNSLKSEISRHFGGRIAVEIAESAEEALEVLDFLLRRNHEIVVVVSDYVMPNMKGDELLSRVHEMLPATKKILLTGQANLEGVTNAINQASLYRYIAKPWETNDLMMTLEAAVQSYEQDTLLQAQNEELRLLNANLEQKVAERTAALQETNNQIQASIRYAQRIQSAVLPSLETIAKSFSDYFIFYQPRDVVSGDFYWFAEKEHKTIIVAADCTGHGVPGAFMSLIGNDLLNRAVHDREVHAPEKILEQVDKSLNRVWRNENTTLRDGMDVSVVVIDRQEQTLSFAGARGVVLVFDAKGQMHYLKGDKTSIDGRKVSVFTRQSLPLEGKTRFYLYSDGFQDQFGGEDNFKFTSKRLRNFIAELQTQPLTAQSQIVADTFFKWKGDLKQTDDVLLMGFEI